MRYIKSFQNDAAIQAAVDDKSLGKPYVALNDATGEIDWNGKNSKLAKPLTFEILTDGYIEYLINNADLDYSKNGGPWVNMSSNLQIPVVAGDEVSFRGDNNAIIQRSTQSFFSGSTCSYNLSGNIMSLLHRTGFEAYTTLPDNGNSGVFRYLFGNCSGLRDASELLLPATSLTQRCYAGLFYFCTNNRKGPELPAATLVESCYADMFTYNTNINYVKCLATDISAHLATYDWFKGEEYGTGTFVKKAGVEWPRGKDGIPSKWTVVEE